MHALPKVRLRSMYVLWKLSTAAVLSCSLLTLFPRTEAGEYSASYSSFPEGVRMVDVTSRHPAESGVNGTTGSLPQVFLFLRQAEPETHQISRAAENVETAVHTFKEKATVRPKREVGEIGALSVEEVELIMNLSGCPPPVKPATCPNSCLSTKYRSISGVCNNRKHPHWGAANSALARWLPAEYEDGETQPKGWTQERLYNGFPLPPVREVSKRVMQSSSGHILRDEEYSQMLVDWGQYIDHDMSFTPQSLGPNAAPGGADCLATCENKKPCFPIKVLPSDTQFGIRRCMPFFRSSPACVDDPLTLCQFPLKLERQQLNSITSFLDASTVYGHLPNLERRLRNLTSPEGHLKVNDQFSDRGLPYMPFIPGGPSRCFQDPVDPAGDRVECFLAGDSRASEILPLASLHTLWVREHNRLASVLKNLNPQWSAEQTYQEARKIVGALHQIITYRDYVPKILGEEAFQKFVGNYEGYNDSVNPAVSNVFATAAFRFGHATISSILVRLNESFQEHDTFRPLSLRETFFSPWRLVKEGGLDPVLRALLGTAAIAVSRDYLMPKDLTEKLVVLSSPGSLDLSSLNLQRGRDHGLPGYNDFRAFCGLQRLETQAELGTVISDAHLVGILIDLYKHPSNIDVWLGGLLEDPLPGARLGPLFACLIGKQMKMLRDGDRFWWENQRVFTEEQREQLQKHTLSRVICDNSGVREVPPDPFRLGRYPDDFLQCDNIPTMELQAWQEDLSKGLMQCGSPAQVENGDFVFCSTPDKLAAVYSCHHGHRLEGGEETTCTAGSWSSQPPVCESE